MLKRIFFIWCLSLALDIGAQNTWWLPITDTGEITYYGDPRIAPVEHSLVRETLAITYPENECRRIEAEFSQAKEDCVRSQGIYVQDVDYTREVQHKTGSDTPDLTIARVEQPQRYSCNHKEHLALVCDAVVADIAQLKSAEISHRALGMLNLYSTNYLLPYEQSQEYQKLLYKFQTYFDPVTGELLTCEYDFYLSDKVRGFVTACAPGKLEQVCEILGDYSGRKILEDLKRPALQRVVDDIGACIEKVITAPAQFFASDSYVHKIRHNQSNKDLQQVIELCAQNKFDQAQAIRVKYRVCAAQIVKFMDTVYVREYQRYQQEYDEFGVSRKYAHDPWWRDMPAAEKQAFVAHRGATSLNQELRERQKRFTAVCTKYGFTQQEQSQYRDGIYVYADCQVSCLSVERIFEERAAVHAAMVERWRASLSSEKQEEKIERMRKWIAAYEEVLEEKTAGSVRYSTIKNALEPAVVQCLTTVQAACEVFEQCYGNALQQRMHEDYVAAVETIATAVDRCTGITTLAQVAHSALELAGIGCEFNKIALVDRAADVLEVCHQALNWACVVPESLALGAGRFTSFCGHAIIDPEGTASKLWEVNKELLTLLGQEYWYSAAYKELAELDYEAVQRWSERHESTLLTTLESACGNIAQIPAREVIKEGLAFATEWVLMSKLNSAATRFSRSLVQASKETVAELTQPKLCIGAIGDVEEVATKIAQRDAALVEIVQEAAVAPLQKIPNSGPERWQAIREILYDTIMANSPEVIRAFEILNEQIENMRNVYNWAERGIDGFTTKWIKHPYEHLFGPDFILTKNGYKMEGMHHDYQQFFEKSGVIKLVDQKIGKLGIINANIECLGKRYPNKTLFPPSMTREEVMEVIMQARTNIVESVFDKTGKASQIGIAECGIEIKFYVEKNGTISTEYPIYKSI